MIVIADTSPINYLILIGEVHVLHQLYETVILPQTVVAELQHEATAQMVQQWIAQRPNWLRIAQPSAQTVDRELERLGPGERDAILLAQELRADRIVIDELTARKMAASRSLEVIGTVGVLEEAAVRDLVDFPVAIRKLQQTSFRIDERIIEKALERESERLHAREEIKRSREDDYGPQR